MPLPSKYKSNRIFFQISKIILLATLLLCSSSIFASAIGLPQNTIRFGIASQMGIYSVADPQGESRKKYFVQPYNFVVTDWLPNAWRYTAEFYYADMLFEADVNKTGQTVEQYGSRIFLMRNLGILDFWKPWLGFGMDLSYANYKQRHLVDDEGFLIAQFNDRKTVSSALLFQLANEWQMDRNWDLGAKLQYALPLNNSIRSVSVGLYLLYRGF